MRMRTSPFFGSREAEEAVEAERGAAFFAALRGAAALRAGAFFAVEAFFLADAVFRIAMAKSPPSCAAWRSAGSGHRQSTDRAASASGSAGSPAARGDDFPRECSC